MTGSESEGVVGRGDGTRVAMRGSRVSYGLDDPREMKWNKARVAPIFEKREAGKNRVVMRSLVLA